MTGKTGPQPDGRRVQSLTGPARQVYQAVLAAFALDRAASPPAASWSSSPPFSAPARTRLAGLPADRPRDEKCSS